MKVYNVAIVGCGQMGRVHLEHIYFKPYVNIVCACDKNIDRAKDFMAKYGAKDIETDAEKCIMREDVDIVIIATYPSSHLQLLKLCIKYKKHVICEKPIASSLKEGEEFLHLVKQNPDVKVLIGHILRHNETYKKVAEMIHNGAIGKPIIMRMSQNHHTLNWERYLKLIEETSPIVDCGVHYIDVMQWFTGAKVVSVQGMGMRTDIDVPEGKNNYEIVTVKLSDGSVAFYEAGWTKTIASDNLKEFVGPLGSIKIIYQKDRISHIEQGDLIEYYNLEEDCYKSINIHADRKPTDLQFDYLLEMIETGIEAVPTIDEAFSSFKLALMAEETIKNG